jgi:hypothetical protein
MPLVEEWRNSQLAFVRFHEWQDRRWERHVSLEVEERLCPVQERALLYLQLTPLQALTTAEL